MKTTIILLLLVALTVLISPTNAQDGGGDTPLPITNSHVEALRVSSPTNGQDYLIFVSLPSNYISSDENYPVLYVTDPQFMFGTLSEAQRVLQLANEIPELIIVGIGYPEIQQLGTEEHDEALSRVFELRNRDMIPAHEAEAFLAFLTDTLIPQIDATYRTDSEDRAIAGVAPGGTFVLYTLVHAQNTFNRFLSISPTLPGSPISSEIVEEASEPLSGRVYLATGDSGIEGTVVAPGVEEVVTELENANYEELHVSFQIFTDSTHFSILPLALSRGLKAIYCSQPAGPCPFPISARGE